jgi:hypothetical protein
MIEGGLALQSEVLADLYCYNPICLKKIENYEFGGEGNLFVCNGLFAVIVQKEIGKSVSRHCAILFRIPS